VQILFGQNDREPLKSRVTGKKEKTIAPPTVLAGDIGGTNTRLALFEVKRLHLHRIVERTFQSRDYKGLEAVLRDFSKEKIEIKAACFGVAGPVIDGQATATNLPWHLDCRFLQKELSLDKVALINDLVANAYGIAVLKKSDLAVLNPGTVKEGNAVLISAGTGLGQAVLFWNGRKHVPSASEGGHVEFGPRNELEIKLFQYLFNRFGHVSYERVLSGAGLRSIYEFLKDSGKFGREPKWLYEEMRQEDPAAVISKTAESRKNRGCEKAMDMFASIYGAAAGNLALQVMAIGGVYIGGGIAPKIIWKLKEGTFMKAFSDKGRLSEVISQIPVKVVMNDRAALLGAAYRAMEMLGE
jgi:glucokinase